MMDGPSMACSTLEWDEPNRAIRHFIGDHIAGSHQCLLATRLCSYGF